MASSAYMTTMMNCFNDMKRDILSDVLKALDSKDLLTDEIKDVINTMSDNIKANKKIKKEKKPRFSGYHLFMKEHRVVVKEERPDIKPQELTSIVSKAWKDVSEEKKQEYNDRAQKMKEEALSSSSSEGESSSSTTTKKKEDSDSEVEKPKKEKKPPAATKKEEKKPKKEKKAPTKKAKKPPTPPPSNNEESDDDEINVEIENADSDIDL